MLSESLKLYDELMNDIDVIYNVVDYRNRLRNNYTKSIEKLTEEKEENLEYLEKFKRAKKVIQTITDERNTGVKDYIKDLVERGITTIRQEHAYNLEITDDNRGESQKVTHIQLISTKTGKPRKVGTAVKQTTSLIFIISIIEMSKCSKMICLDEYLSGASGATASKLGDVLVALSKNNNFQFFVVNHVPEISDNPDFVRIYLENNNDEEGLHVNWDKTKKDMTKRKNIKADIDELVQ